MRSRDMPWRQFYRQHEAFFTGDAGQVFRKQGSDFGFICGEYLRAEQSDDATEESHGFQHSKLQAECLLEAPPTEPMIHWP